MGPLSGEVEGRARYTREDVGGGMYRMTLMRASAIQGVPRCPPLVGGQVLWMAGLLCNYSLVSPLRPEISRQLQTHCDV